MKAYALNDEPGTIVIEDDEGNDVAELTEGEALEFIRELHDSIDTARELKDQS